MAQREPRIQSIKRGKYLIWGKRSPISDFSNVDREREREGKFPSSIHKISSVGLVRPRTKVHHLDEGYA